MYTLKKIIKSYFPNGVTCSSSFTVYCLCLQERDLVLCGHFHWHYCLRSILKHTSLQCVVFQVMLVFVFECYFSYLMVFPILWPRDLAMLFYRLEGLVVFHSHTVLLTSRPSSVSFRCCALTLSLFTPTTLSHFIQIYLYTMKFSCFSSGCLSHRDCEKMACRTLGLSDRTCFLKRWLWEVGIKML